MCSRSTFVRTTTGASSTLVASSLRRGRPRRPHPLPARNSASAAASAPRTAWRRRPRRPGARGRTASGRPARRSPGLAPPSRSRAVTCTRRPSCRPPRAGPRTSASSSSCHSYRLRELPERLLRIAERREEPAHALEAELLRPRRERLDQERLSAELVTTPSSWRAKSARAGRREPAATLKYAGDRGRWTAMLAAAQEPAFVAGSADD